MSNMSYQVTLISLLVIGLLLASVFLVQFRPRQWARLVTWDASGWVLLIVLWFIRSLSVIAARWPNLTTPGLLDGVLSIGLLVIIDVLLLVRVASYRSFVRHEADNRKAADGS